MQPRNSRCQAKGSHSKRGLVLECSRALILNYKDNFGCFGRKWRQGRKRGVEERKWLKLYIVITDSTMSDSLDQEVAEWDMVGGDGSLVMRWLTNLVAKLTHLFRSTADSCHGGSKWGRYCSVFIYIDLYIFIVCQKNDEFLLRDLTKTEKLFPFIDWKYFYFGLKSLILGLCVCSLHYICMNCKSKYYLKEKGNIITFSINVMRKH